jgi:hypothetical protein
MVYRALRASSPIALGAALERKRISKGHTTDEARACRGAGARDWADFEVGLMRWDWWL